MTDKQTPPDWVLIEAAKRSGWGDNGIHVSAYTGNPVFRALCDMIEKHEQPPVDRKLLCAREAATLNGYEDYETVIKTCLTFHELWESGYGA